MSEVAFAPEFADILDHHRRIFNFEAARNYAYEYEEHRRAGQPGVARHGC